jgi:hypothetical protein
MMLATAVMLLQLVTAATRTEAECGSLARALGGGSIDLAPPEGFVEICAQDATLCRTLTAAYGKSVTTLGYFVTVAEWAAHAKMPAPSFSRYLIAQAAPSKTAAQLPEVKSFIRSQQHGAPERSRLAATLRTDGQAQLGILDDTPDSISMGAVAKLPSATPGAGSERLLAMTNSALAVGPDLLSLYVYSRIDDTKDVQQVEALTARWLRCVREANRR